MNLKKQKPYSEAGMFTVIGAFLIAISSLLKWHATNSFMVDFNPVFGWKMYAILGLYYGGFALFIYGYTKIVLNKDGFTLTVSNTKKIALTVLACMLLMAPMLSNDMTLYMAYGDLAANNKFAFTNGELLKTSQFIDYVAPRWSNCPSHYGPPLIYLFQISVFIGKTIVGSLMVFKVITFLFGWFFIEISTKFYNEFKVESKYNTYALVVLSPLVWLQGVGQLHVDIIIASFIVAVLYALRKEKWVIAAFFTTLIILSKTLYAAIFIPFIFTYLLVAKKWNVKNAFLPFVKIVLVLGITFAAFYAEIWDGLETLTNPISYHDVKEPNESNVAVISDIIFYATPLFIKNSDGASLKDATVEDEENEASKVKYWKFFTKLFQILSLILAIWVGFGLVFIKQAKDVIPIFTKLLIIVVCFYSSIFHPWYFLLPLPFLLFTKQKSWVIYGLITFTICNFVEPIVFITPRDHFSHWIVVPFVFITLISFYLYFKKHFIVEPYLLIKNAKVKNLDSTV